MVALAAGPEPSADNPLARRPAVGVEFACIGLHDEFDIPED